MYIGDEFAAYQDSLYWIAALRNISTDNDFTLLINSLKLPGSTSYLVPQFVMHPNQLDFKQFTDYELIIDLDEESQIYIGANNDQTVVIGTSNAGQISINTIKDDLVSDIKLGQNFPYTVADVTESYDGKCFVITGTTKIQHQIQRVFLIKIPKSEL